MDKGCEDLAADCGGALRPVAGSHLGETPSLEGFLQVGMVIRGIYLPNSHGRARDSWRWPPAAAEGAVLVQNRMENHSAAPGTRQEAGGTIKQEKFEKRPLKATVNKLQLGCAQGSKVNYE